MWMISDLLHALNLYFGHLLYRDVPILSDDDLALLPTVPVVVVVVLFTKLVIVSLC